MMRTGNQIRKEFIDFFISKGHTVVASASLVPGGDQTLLFTNAGMVQFKDVFLGTDHRPYTRAVDSQKCMRVAGKHNDLDDVGRDDFHHTFFEMLGNWSFGDYYKKEAISWAWELLTNVWGLDKSRLWTTCFKDEEGIIPTDEEAADYWREQPGINPDHVLFFGRKDNFWEMAEIGPCGPDSEIHLDRGAEFCDKQGVPGHVCRVNGDCKRFLELWNLVFIQYNRLSPTQLEPLPTKHVDTGMGFERIVSVLQNVSSNYFTDLLLPLMEEVRVLANQTIEQMDNNLTPYRVIADHARSAAFLIADGVIPGNTGRNYVCRMIIRRAARFGGKLGLSEPFLSKIAEKVIEGYGEAYPELVKNKQSILDHITREEKRFQRTIEGGLSHLEEMFAELREEKKTILSGERAFDLYATHGLPYEISRDIAREQGMEVDEAGFRKAMEEHRLTSGGGKAIGKFDGEDVEIFRSLFNKLVAEKKIGKEGVIYDPYQEKGFDSTLLAILRDGEEIEQVDKNDEVAILIPQTNFYLESGGQVADKGRIVAKDGAWEVMINDVRRPAAGIIVHEGVVVKGMPKVGDAALVEPDIQRRHDIMRNHTATHLLHAELHRVLGEHARQAGSLVAPDRLRFDFTHPEAVKPEQLAEIEAGVNRAIFENHKLNISQKPLKQAMSEGAMALFGEKYGEMVRTISIGDQNVFSYELCGGTHVEETGDVGIFLITSESSAAAGIRRIEAVTGRGAYEMIRKRFDTLTKSADLMKASIDELPQRIIELQDEADETRKKLERFSRDAILHDFNQRLLKVDLIEGIPVMATDISNADMDSLRLLADKFREKNPSGTVVLGTVQDGRPMIIAAITDDLVKRGLNAGELVREIAPLIGGSGGGRPNMAQAGGKDPSGLESALKKVPEYIKAHLR